MISRNELINIVLSDARVKEISNLSQEELSNLFGKDFSVMKDYSQNNPHHHLDLLNHTLTVVRNIKKDNLLDEEFIDLRIAALFHDVAKPLVKKEKEGRSVFYGHAKTSHKLAEDLLLNIGFQQDEMKRILFLIRFHDSFISFKFQYEMNDHHSPHVHAINPENVKKTVDDICHESEAQLGYKPTKRDLYLILIHFCQADQEGQAKEAVFKGKVIDTRADKQERLRGVWQCLCKIPID